MTYVSAVGNLKDLANSSTTPLGISGVFTGAWVACLRYAEIRISYDADEEGVSCFIQFSEDGINVERSIPVPPEANTLQTNFGGVHTINPIIEYYRIVYTNGAVAQTKFTLSSILAGRSGIGLISRSTQVLNKYNDVALRRVVSEPEGDRNLQLLSYQSSKRKFGKNEAVGNSVFETVWTYTANWIPNQNLETIEAISSDANDTSAGSGARTIEVTFLNSDWEEVTETLTMNGTSATTPTTVTGYRVLSAKVKDTGTYHSSNEGNITLRTSTSGDILGYIAAVTGLTEQSIFTVPSGKTMYITEVIVSVGTGNSADVKLLACNDVDIFSAPFGAAREEWALEDYSGADVFPLKTWLKFEEKTDVWAEAIRITGSGSARVSVDFNYILQDN